MHVARKFREMIEIVLMKCNYHIKHQPIMLRNSKLILSSFFLEEKKECKKENYQDGMYPLFRIHFLKRFYEFNLISFICTLNLL